MAQEIEIKLQYTSKNEVLKILKALGMKPRKKFSLQDTYFSQSKDMSYRNDLIRIRQKDGHSELTFKGKGKLNKAILKRVELTSEISSPKAVKEIFQRLGLFKIRENVSFREAYDLEGFQEIVFVDFLKLVKLSLIELEGSEDRINEVLMELGDKVKKTGEEIFKEFDKLSKKKIFS